MIGSIKALIFVLGIAVTIFHLARPLALQFMSAEDFRRRRFVWLFLTVACFISPNFWIYVVVAVPVLFWANRRESNPVALYLLILHVIPPIGVVIPILGNAGLFALDNYRLLAGCVLLPAVIRYRKSQSEGANRLGIMDFLLLGFIALEIALYIPPDFYPRISDSPSNVLRRIVLLPLDIYLLYFAVSRTCQTRRQIVDAAAAFCLACGLMAALAMFETMRNWLLYTEIALRWGNNPHAGVYLVREGSLRAQVSAGHAIALGNLLAVGYGLWLFLKSEVLGRIRRIGVTVLLWGGLYATSSRGAWLGAAVMYFVFLCTRPRAIASLAKGTVAAFAIVCLIVVSPIGSRILGLLPEAGKPADAYRSRLAERGWEVALSHPFFGIQFPWPEMEDLRQGEGIIDLVNSYLGIVLDYGLIGLLLFLSFILVGMRSAYSHARRLADTDPSLSLYGASLVACIAGVLIMLRSNGFDLGLQKSFYVLAGLSAAYAGVARSSNLRPDNVSPQITRQG